MLARDKMPSSTPLSHFSSYSDRVAVKIMLDPFQVLDITPLCLMFPAYMCELPSVLGTVRCVMYWCMHLIHNVQGCYMGVYEMWCRSGECILYTQCMWTCCEVKWCYYCQIKSHFMRIRLCRYFIQYDYYVNQYLGIMCWTHNIIRWSYWCRFWVWHLTEFNVLKKKCKWFW